MLYHVTKNHLTSKLTQTQKVTHLLWRYAIMPQKARNFSVWLLKRYINEKKLSYHPSLDEVLKEHCNYEWLETDISGFFIGDFADSENEKGSISRPEFLMFSNASESEYGSISFERAIISIYLAKDDELQNLKGDTPLGSINYYDKDDSGININVSSKIYSHLVNLLVHDIDNISLKVAIPIWSDTSSKSLPLLKYQLVYKNEK